MKRHPEGQCAFEANQQIKKLNRLKQQSNEPKAAMSEEEAKGLYMEANAMKDEDPEKAMEILQRIIDLVDPDSKRYKKAKELLKKLK